MLKAFQKTFGRKKAPNEVNQPKGQPKNEKKSTRGKSKLETEKKQSEDNSSLRVEPGGQSEDQLDGPSTKGSSSAETNEALKYLAVVTVAEEAAERREEEEDNEEQPPVDPVDGLGEDTGEQPPLTVGTETVASTGAGEIEIELNMRMKFKRNRENCPEGEVYRHIDAKYFQKVDSSDQEDINGFVKHITTWIKGTVKGTKKGSLIIIVECSSMEILDVLWEDCYTSILSERAQRYLVTEDLLRVFGLTEVKCTATIEEKDYRACREYFLQCQVKDNLLHLQLIELDAERRVKTSKVLLADIEKVALSRGFTVSDNPGSGNCMFHALSEQLELVKGIKVRHENLRKTLVQFLKENPELPDGTRLFRFVSGYPSWADYLTSMDKDGTWGDHLMLYAAANCYDTDIRVIVSVPDQPDIIITSTNADLTHNSANPLVLGYIQELHYVSLQPQKVRCIDAIVAIPTLVDELARCLDKEYRVLKYWKHLAYNLEIPLKIQKGFDVYFELSPTIHLFPFLSTLPGRDPLSIGKLKTALEEIHRNDLKNKLQDFNDTEIVDDVFDRNPSLLGSIAVELDSAKRPLGHWRVLASKLIADDQRVTEFEAELHYPSGNPTARLFSYLSKTEAFRYLKISQLKKKLNDMQREDVVKLLVDAKVQDDSFLTEVLRPDSDLLNNISTCLNKKSPGVKNWKVLAYKLGVSNEVYDEFDERRKSPTKMMLEWLNSKRSGLTVKQLRTALEEIGRADALKIIDRYLSQ